MKHEGWQISEDLGVSLDPGQVASLEGYEALLADVAIPMGMVARNDAPRLRERHVLDCLRASPFVPVASTSCDMGSGAGLPGIPLAIARPDVRIVLAEVRRNRAAFLERAITELGLGNVSIHGRRLETYREAVDVCFARAFGEATTAWTAASRLLADGGRLIYWAGERFDVEADKPPGVRMDLFPTSALARSGSLAIMTRQ